MADIPKRTPVRTPVVRTPMPVVRTPVVRSPVRESVIVDTKVTQQPDGSVDIERMVIPPQPPNWVSTNLSIPAPETAPVPPRCRKCGGPPAMFSTLVDGSICVACHDAIIADLHRAGTVCILCKAKPPNFHSAQLMGLVCAKCYVQAEVTWMRAGKRDTVLALGRNLAEVIKPLA